MARTKEEPNQDLHTTVESVFQEKSHDFSLVLGGPIFQLLRKLHLEGEGAALLPRRLLSITAIAWLPLLLLTLLGSSSGGARVSFLHDVEVHARFLVARAKRQGLARYGLLAQRYVENFEQKWIEYNSPGEDLLGAADIQSLADLGNSYALVREMRSVPFGLDDMTRLAIATAAPFLPLLLTVFSLEELIMRLIKVLF